MSLKTTHLFSFFSSSFPFGTCKERLKKKHSQGGKYQVAVKNNATVDNHQAIRAYHQSFQGKYPRPAEQGKQAHSSSLIKCMGRGVKPPGNKGRYKNITGGEFARPRTPGDQDQHHHTTNNITPRTSPQLRPHHHHRITTTQYILLMS
jgi:hypothetical protein